MNIILETFGVTFGQLALLALLGFFIGIDKMGLRGGPVIVVPFLATAFGARFTAGLIAPLLLGADLIAIIVYRRNCNKRLVFNVMVWAAIGLVIGALVGEVVPDEIFQIILGIILIILLSVMMFLEFSRGEVEIPDRPFITAPICSTAGFASMIGNAAGPILSLFLLAKKIPKQSFLGSSAMIFLILNSLKLPLHIFYWNTVTVTSMKMDLLCIPFILIGAAVGKPLVALIPEKPFRYFIMAGALIGAVRLFL